MTATLYVCTTCKRGEPVPDDTVPPGARLHAALLAAGAPEGVRIVGVECLSACNTGCAVSLSMPGAWSYVYGRLGPENAPEILEGAAKYAATSDGIVVWRERPTIFRKQSIARIPPLEAAE
jgi:predicted metal-binding protein